MSTTNSLQHHGILGMKWGVRRYQNYDGSYTQEGMRRYRESMEGYEKSRAKEKQTKADYKSGKATKLDVNRAKNKRRDWKRQLNKDYDQLRKDKVADEGKKLYQEGKTITDVSIEGRGKIHAATSISIGASVLTRELARNGNMKAAAGTALVANGSALVAGILWHKSRREKEQIRAYYGHSRGGGKRLKVENSPTSSNSKTNSKAPAYAKANGDWSTRTKGGQQLTELERSLPREDFKKELDKAQKNYEVVYDVSSGTYHLNPKRKA